MPQYPIILIHGFPLDADMWQPQVDALRAKGHDVIAPDLPGFGQSAGGPPCETLDAAADFVHSFIPQGKKAVIAGLSMGGYITLALLARHPESVAAAMLLDTRADPDSPEARQARMDSIKEIQTNGPEKLYTTLLGRLVSKHATAEVQKRLQAMMHRQNPATVIAAQKAMAARADHTQTLAAVKVPLLVLVGAEDVITPPSVAMGMHTRVPHSMLVQIAGAGHMTTLEAPERVTGAMETFLATVRG